MRNRTSDFYHERVDKALVFIYINLQKAQIIVCVLKWRVAATRKIEAIVWMKLSELRNPWSKLKISVSSQAFKYINQLLLNI